MSEANNISVFFIELVLLNGNHEENVRLLKPSVVIRQFISYI